MGRGVHALAPFGGLCAGPRISRAWSKSASWRPLAALDPGGALSTRRNRAPTQDGVPPLHAPEASAHRLVAVPRLVRLHWRRSPGGAPVTALAACALQLALLTPPGSATAA